MKPLSVVRPTCVLLSAALAVGLGTTGCSSSSGSFPTIGGQESTTGAPVGTTTEPGGTGATVPAGPYLLIGGPPLELLTPEQGAGAYPRFEWTAVPSAAHYMLFVFDTDGVMFWAWAGDATSVYLGGLDRPPTPGSMGPALDGPMSWAVIAFDAGQNLIASSVTRPIAP